MCATTSLSNVSKRTNIFFPCKSGTPRAGPQGQCREEVEGKSTQRWQGSFLCAMKGRWSQLLHLRPDWQCTPNHPFFYKCCTYCTSVGQSDIYMVTYVHFGLKKAVLFYLQAMCLTSGQRQIPFSVCGQYCDLTELKTMLVHIFLFIMAGRNRQCHVLGGKNLLVFVPMNHEFQSIYNSQSTENWELGNANFVNSNFKNPPASQNKSNVYCVVHHCHIKLSPKPFNSRSTVI